MTVREFYLEFLELWVDFTGRHYIHDDTSNRLLFQIRDKADALTTMSYIGIASISILIILGLIILWNQRKIKKMLRDLQEQNRKDDDDSN